jgi:phage-related protein
VYPVISIQANGADMDDCTLKNLTTGQSMNFDGTVSDGNVLEIDCLNRTVKNDGVSSVGDFAASGHFIKLVPGTNYLKFTGDNCIIKIDWFDKWI